MRTPWRSEDDLTKKRVSYAIGHYACFVPLPKLFQTKFLVGQILNTIRFAHLNDYTAIGTWWEEAVKKFTETIVKI